MPSWISTGISSQPQAQNKIVLSLAKLTVTLTVTDAISVGKPESPSWKHSGIFMVTNASYHILFAFQIISVRSDHCGILSEFLKYGIHSLLPESNK